MLLIYFEDKHHAMICSADKPTDSFIDAALVLSTLEKLL